MFTIGDAIVLVVVLIILAVYRQLDVNNRTLEKVRRYSDKAQQDLDRISAQKATEIRDMALEVDVHQKSAVEVLKRLVASQDELNSKSEQFESFSRRIQEYDAALHELLEMTHRAEENIGRVRDESEYIDKVGKRIKNTAGQLEQLEKRIPGITLEFQKTNAAQLEKERKSLVAYTAQQLEDFSQNIEGMHERIHDFQDHVQSVEARGATLQSDVENSIRNIYEELAHEAESFSDRKLNEFSEEIELNVQKAADSFETLENNADAVIRTSADRVTELKNTAEKSLAELLARFSEAEEDYTRKLEDVAARGERMETAALQGIRERISGNIKSVESLLADSVSSIQSGILAQREDLSEEIRAFSEEYMDKQQEIAKAADEFLRGLESRFQRGTQEIDEKILAVQNGLSGAEEMLSLNYNDIIARLGSYTEDSDSTIRTLFSELNEKIESSEQKFSEALQLSEQNSHKHMNVRFSKLTNDIDAETGALRESLDHRVTQLQQLTQDQHDNIDTMFQGLKNEVEQWLGGIKADIHEFEEKESMLKTQIYNLEIGLNSTAEGLDSRVNEFGTDLLRQQSELREGFIQFQQDILNQENELQEVLDGFIEDVNSQLPGRLAVLQDQWGQDCEGLQDRFNQKLQHIQQSLLNASGELSESLSEQRQSSSLLISDSVSDMTREILSDVEARLGAAEGDYNERLSVVEQQGDFFQGKLSEMREYVQEAVQSAEQYKLDSAASLEDAATALRERLADLRSSLNQELVSVRDGSFRSFTSLKENLQNDFSGFQSEIREELGVVRDNIDQELNLVQSNSREKSSQVEAEFMQSLRLLENSMTDRSSEIEHELLEVREKSQQNAGRIEAELMQGLSRLEGSMSARSKEIEEELLGVKQISLQKSSSFESEMAQNLGLLENRLTERGREIELGFSEKTREIEESLSSRTEEIEQSWSRRSTDLQQLLETAYENIHQDLEERHKDAYSKMDSGIAGLERKLLGLVESRIGETETMVGARLDSIHLVADDIDQLEDQLRNMIQRSGEALHNEISSLGEQLISQRKEDLLAAQTDMGVVRQEMQALESGLDELKKQAYDSVNAKLQMFEDDFFNDLRSRTSSMESQLADWQDSIAEKIEVHTVAYSEERQLLEQQYTNSLKNSLADMQQKSNQQYERLSEQLQETEKILRQHYADIEQQAEGAEEQIRTELEEIRQQSREQLVHELRQHSDEYSAQIREFEKSLQTELRGLQENAQAGKLQLETVLDATRADVTLWQTEVLQKLGSAEKNIDSDIAGLKLETENSIASVRDDFARQRDILITQTEQERENLQNQMQAMFSQAAELDQRLSSEISNALESFAIRYEQYQSEFLSGMKEREQGIDSRFREFRGLVQDTREKFDSMEDKLFSKLEDRANLLGLNVTEIEKRQKAFVEQTKIFERADSLKISLQESIEELKTDLQRVENQRKELREMETQFQKLRKLGDEAIEKMGRFTQEKRRIDQLESGYQELMRLSQAVDAQVQMLTDSHDTMQNMQIKIRSLEELQESVNERYERMQTKSDVINGTARAIDEGFQKITQMETAMQDIEAELSSVPGQINEIKQMIGSLHSEKESVEQAVNQLANLNSIMNDVEARINKVQTAREWLARTETRFDELTREADEQLRLLGSLLREKPDDNKRKSNEAPSVQARDTVIKLSRNGWQVDEIAKATKLSPGEVELILEIAHK
ncbi:SpiroCoCo family coiled-coil protein [Spirochaeta dissipatitropha]